VATWLLSAATWRVGPDGHLELAAWAQALQYGVVVVAAILAGHRFAVRARLEPADAADFGFFDHRASIRRDLTGRVWWTCLWAGMAAMCVNVAILVAAETAFGRPDLWLFAGWLGAAIPSGAFLGMLVTFVPLLLTRGE
jgi:hypothetical protein